MIKDLRPPKNYPIHAIVALVTVLLLLCLWNRLQESDPFVVVGGAVMVVLIIALLVLLAKKTGFNPELFDASSAGIQLVNFLIVSIALGVSTTIGDGFLSFFSQGDNVFLLLMNIIVCLLFPLGLADSVYYRDIKNSSGCKRTQLQRERSFFTFSLALWYLVVPLIVSSAANKIFKLI